MLTQEAVLQAVKDKTIGYDRSSNEMVDGRDFSRLCVFFPLSELDTFGKKLAEETTDEEWIEDMLEWTEKVIKEQLKSDLDFAFDKATDQRGISSSLMAEVINMWMWILEDDLATFMDYEPYGIPLLKRVAKKYELPDRSGEYFD